MAKSRSRLSIAVVSALGFITPVRAEFIDTLGNGLAFLGFDLRGRRNVLSGGIDFQTSTVFQGNELDFGVGDATISGPFFASISTGGRGLGEFEFSMRTAVNANSQAVPLTYTLDVDPGVQRTQVDGTYLLDTNIKINRLGFYRVNLTTSSRQTIAREGSLFNDSRASDFDIGPVSVSGNIFVDIASAVTEPFFRAAGVVNPLSGLSGAEQLKEIVAVQRNGTGAELAENTFDELISASNRLASTGRSSLAGPFPASPSDSPVSSTLHAVPEPAVIVLMLVAVPLVFTKRCFASWRRWRARPSDSI